MTMKFGLLAFAALLPLLQPLTAAAQTAPGVARDPNPPYGAAAGAIANRPPAGVASTGTATAGASAAVPTGPAVGSTAAPTVTRTPGGSGATASGASGAGTAAAGGTRAGQAVASGGTTSASAAAPAPYDPRTAPGWTMMTPQEQQNYSGRMSSFTSQAECRAYQQAYMAQIQARARSMGQIVQSPASDPCVGLR